MAHFLPNWQQTQGAEPQMMPESSVESLLCGRWTAAGLLPGHAAPRLFEELKARGGSLRDLHLHLHAPGSATVSALVCREACVSKEPLTYVSKILPTAGCQCWILPKTLEMREEKWETVNVYVCAQACTWLVMQQALRVGLNTLCEKTLTSFFLRWEKLFFHMSFSFGLGPGADFSEQSP